MGYYSIKDLERISSTKAHTIRMWEQRYALLEPERTDTNIRVYNDEHLRKLLNVCTLLHKGFKISTISKLSKAQLAQEIDHIIAGSFQADVHIEALINRALIAIATYDAPSFDALFADALKRLGLRKTYEKIIYPLLVRTGLMWAKEDLLPAQEHFLSNLLRQKLFAAIEALPAVMDADQSWVLFLNEGEGHEIGLLFASYLIRQYGKKVVYLGARVPYADLSAVVQQVRPTHIYSFLINPIDDETGALPAGLAADFEDIVICISGGNDHLRAIPETGNIKLIRDIEALTTVLSGNHAI